MTWNELTATLNFEPRSDNPLLDHRSFLWDQSAASPIEKRTFLRF
jgi:hypothetical protein